jgi:hypothetical protein
MPRVFNSIAEHEQWKRQPEVKPRGRGGLVPTAAWRAQRAEEMHQASLKRLSGMLGKPQMSVASAMYSTPASLIPDAKRGHVSPLGGVAKEMKT